MSKKFRSWWKKHRPSTMKLVVWFVLLNAIAWTWCSYYLAYIGREQIAESLSKVAVTEVIGVVVTYSIKSMIEKISQYNPKANGEIEREKMKHNEDRDC